MTRNTQLTAALFATMTLGASSALAATTTFGNNNDVLGGFTQTAGSSTVIWTTQGDSVQYRNQDVGTQNGSFLGEYVLNRSSGSAYTITGVVTLTDGYADDNNRVGIYLFGDAAQIVDQNEAGAVGLIFNTDDGSAGGVGTDAVDGIYLKVGIDSTDLSPTSLRNQTTTPYAQNLFGTQITLSADIAFVGTDIQIGATMTDSNGDVTTIAPITVAAADYTGDYFGFVTRSRARNYVEGGPNSPEGRSLPWVMDYESFSVVQTAVPEPSSLALIALSGMMIARRRRG